MSAPDREGSRALAAYLRIVQEGRQAGLPPELAAEEAWPFFRRAVAAALREGHALRGSTRAAWGGDLPLAASGVGSTSSQSRV